eukprot:1179785-Prorocentrum_minimum.AAC.1
MLRWCGVASQGLNGHLSSPALFIVVGTNSGGAPNSSAGKGLLVEALTSVRKKQRGEFNSSAGKGFIIKASTSVSGPVTKALTSVRKQSRGEFDSSAGKELLIELVMKGLLYRLSPQQVKSRQENRA